MYGIATKPVMMIVRTTPLLVCLLAIAAITAMLATLQVTTHYFSSDVFAKTVISLGLMGAVIAFLVAVDFDLPNARSKIFLGTALFLGVTLVIFIVSQLWFRLVPDIVFAKLVILDLILFGLAAFALTLFEDLDSENEADKQKYLN